MTPSVSRSAVLQFRSNTGGVVRFTIPRAREDKTAAQAQTAMQAMIANGRIITSAGVPTEIKAADIVRTVRTIII